jgi:hypothetical protein
MDAIPQVHPHRLSRLVLGRMPALTTSWTLAGALAGGAFVVLLLLTGRLHPGGLEITTLLLVSLGAWLGMLHGFMLSVLARPGHEPKPDLWQWTLAGFGAAAAWTVGMTGSLWLSMSAVVALAGRPLGWLGLGAGVAATALILGVASVLGWRALSTAYARWPDHGLGSWLVAGTFLVLTASLLAVRPALPGTQVQLTLAGTVVAAALATLWVALPAIALILPLTHRRSDRQHAG